MISSATQRLRAGLSNSALFEGWSQTWLPSRPGTVGFFKGCYFGVVDSPEADRAALERFTAAIEKALPGESEGHWSRSSF